MIDQTIFNSREDTAYLRSLVNALTLAPTLEDVEGLLMSLDLATRNLLHRVLEHYDD